MNNEPTVSVIIPNYQTDEYLGKAVDSVRDQTYSRTEIILVDSSGTKKAEQIADGEKTTYVYQDPEGLAAARNRGVTESSGDIIAFLDADDWLPPDSLEKRVRALEKHEACAVYTDWYTATEEGKKTEVHSAIDLKKNGQHFVDFFLNEGIRVPTVAVRRAALEKLEGPFNESLKAAEDFHCWTRLFAESEHPPVKIDDPLAVYRIRDNSLSHGNRVQFFNEKRKAVNELIEQYPELARVARKRRSIDDYSRARAALLDDDLDEARSFIWRSVSEDPTQLKSYVLLLISVIPNDALQKWSQTSAESLYQHIKQSE
ncbi:glycosyltransferase [Salarchaeum japonicum]|uniref:glycosyltransferase n=1 Tax=Salarchaeum japonicum TaxID=555573 RepID=UPI003C70E9F7